MIPVALHRGPDRSSVVLPRAKTGLLIILETLTGRGSSIFVMALFVWVHCIDVSVSIMYQKRTGLA